MKESVVAKRIGLTKKYIDRVNKMSDEELFIEYIYYSSGSQNSEMIIKSVIFVVSGFFLYSIIYYCGRAIQYLMTLGLSKSRTEFMLSLVIWIVLFTVILIITILYYSFSTMTIKRSRFLYLSQRLKERESIK